MNSEGVFSALLLGIVEGVTEFLPISSTGHLILITELLPVTTPPGRVMEVVIQFGAILAVCWHYRAKLWGMAVGLPTKREEQRSVLKLFLAFLPAAIIGLLAHSTIKEALFSAWVVSVMLVVGGILILIIEKYKPAPHLHGFEEISVKTAIMVGLFQVLAMVPGTSRSGATIMGALLLGIDRRSAAEFSFLLSIPTMLAAAAYDFYKNYHLLGGEDFMQIGIGFAAAFLAALLTVKALLAFLGRHGFVPFAIYRIILGVVMLGLLSA